MHSNHSMNITDYTWHHLCVVWDGETGLVAIFKDGDRIYKLSELRAPTLGLWREGNCFVRT